VYLDKYSHTTTDDMTATHPTVKHLTSSIEGLGHKIFMYNFFSFPILFEGLDRCKINSCRTIWPKRKDMPCDFEPKQLKLKTDDVRVKATGGLNTLVLKYI
jgi:hypothetical protein